ncbi:hypothetical protein ACRZU2_004330, partial [Klebsiella variicola]
RFVLASEHSFECTRSGALRKNLTRRSSFFIPGKHSLVASFSHISASRPSTGCEKPVFASAVTAGSYFPRGSLSRQGAFFRITFFILWRTHHEKHLIA